MAALAVAVLAYVVFALVRSVPVTALPRAARSGVFPGSASGFAWPGRGQAAVGVQGVGVVSSHGPAKPAPIASVAKVMTAYVVLRDHPLRGRASGPQIVLSPTDVAVYQADAASGQSVVFVRAGERLTERKALEGMLLPSGNNIASLLARWDAGSEAAFVGRMNSQARRLGLAHTHYTSASGVKPSTVSTASDQTRLAMQALELPALAQIVAMTQATLPVAGRQDNRDLLLGKDGIVGVKPGTTSEAGGCFVFAARRQIAGQPITLVGAVLGQAAGQPQLTMLAAAFHATTTLLSSTHGLVIRHPVLRRGTTLAWINAPWADPVALQASRSVSLLGWRGLPVHTEIKLPRAIHPSIVVGDELGLAVVAAGEQRVLVALVASRSLRAASLGWRLTHP